MSIELGTTLAGFVTGLLAEHGHSRSLITLWVIGFFLGGSAGPCGIDTTP
jgi:hypothetical protein